jgi:ParB family chromosome partitioning protein
MQTLKIDPRALSFSPWNINVVSPENMVKLKESIKRNGIFRPVVVRENEKGNLEVIAGEHTTRIAIELGHETIDVYNLGPIDERRAKEISVIDNQHYGLEDTFGLAQLLREIDDSPGDFLPFTDDDLTKIFEQTKIDFDSLDIPEDDPSAKDTVLPEESLASMPISHSIMRFKVPVADVESVQRAIEAVMKRQSFKSGDSLQDAGDALVWIINNAGN